MHAVLTSALDAIGPNAAVELDADEARHLVRVRRARVGDAVELLDGNGFRASGSIRAIDKAGRSDHVIVEVGGIAQEPRSVPLLEVWSALPKGDRLPTMIEMLGQVGADRWVPTLADRGVVAARDTKLDRLRRIALESIKQSRRAWPLEIDEPRSLEEGLDAGGSVIVADPRGGAMPALAAGTVRVLIGPEGGWTEEELALARERGAAVVNIGPHVMRIGTAAVVAAAHVRLLAGWTVER